MTDYKQTETGEYLIDTENKTFKEIAYEMGVLISKDIEIAVTRSESSLFLAFGSGLDNEKNGKGIDIAVFQNIFRILVDLKFDEVEKRLSQIEQRLDKLELSPERTADNLFGKSDVINAPI